MLHAAKTDTRSVHQSAKIDCRLLTENESIILFEKYFDLFNTIYVSSNVNSHSIYNQFIDLFKHLTRFKIFTDLIDKSTDEIVVDKKAS